VNTGILRRIQRRVAPKPNEYGFRAWTHFDRLIDAICEFEPERRREWLVLPWTLVRWAFWRVVSILWYRARLHRGLISRTNSPDPVVCRFCLWAGPLYACSHGYTSSYDDDVEPEDCCPRCDGPIN
jgi:hypothetical protein